MPEDEIAGTLIQVLEHLAQLKRGQDEMRADIAKIKTRMSAVEEIEGQILVHLGSMSRRVDKIESRLARVEKHLDLESA